MLHWREEEVVRCRFDLAAAPEAAVGDATGAAAGEGRSRGCRADRQMRTWMAYCPFGFL